MVKKNNLKIFAMSLIPLFLYSACSKSIAVKDDDSYRGNDYIESAYFVDQYVAEKNIDQVFDDFLLYILIDAKIPERIAQNIMRLASEGPAFIMDILAVLQGDPYLRVLVDKSHTLPADYEPDDLVVLSAGSYTVNRQGHLLRRQAAISLEEMARAARADGVTLMASSAYRSYSYQRDVYDRNVRQSGQEVADRESARAGHSQHQLGLVVDFGSIDDSFAETLAGKWLSANASSFGWSISYPKGYEDVTGYRWESWHYRYVGKELAYFIDTYFEGIQQYALQFIYSWEKVGGL